MDPRRRVTTAEAAKLLGVKPATIRSWAHRGLIVAVAATSPRGYGSRMKVYELAALVKVAQDHHAKRKGTP